jgi:antitoxin HigA-1
MTTPLSMHEPAHPGEVLREYFSAGATVTEAATALHISRVMLSKILNARAPVSADMALRLSAWLGTAPAFWLDMQARFDLWALAQSNAPTYAQIVPMVPHGRS